MSNSRSITKLREGSSNLPVAGCFYEDEMLNNDTDSGERARALHRVVRAMHDGECPKCHRLFSSEQMRLHSKPVNAHQCPACGFTITAEESKAALQAFSLFMDENLAVFEEWRSTRK